MSDAQRPPEPPAPAEPRSDDLSARGPMWLLELSKKALEERPRALRLLVYVIGVMGILAVIFACIESIAGQHYLAFWIGMASFVFLLVALLVSYWAVVRFLTLQQPQQAAAVQRPARAAEPTWARRIPKFPLQADRCDDLRRDLNDIRNAAFAWLSQRRGEIDLKPEEVRSNIFLPDYTRPDAGMAFVLYMPDSLRVGMDGHQDEKITFRPGQGLTGLVFVKQELHKAKTIQTGEGRHEFDEIYHLTAEQKKVIHPQLRWIVSFPLTIPEGEKRKAAGVLNVDGLTDP